MQPSLPVAVEKPAAIQHEGRGGVAAVASASSASGGHGGKKKTKKKANKSSKVTRENNMNLLNGAEGPLRAPLLLLVATWTLSEVCLFLRFR